MNFQGALQAERKYNTSMSVCDQLELLSDSRTDLVHFNLPKLEGYHVEKDFYDQLSLKYHINTSLFHIIRAN